MEKVYYAGIDYHKRYSVVCVMDKNGETVLGGTIRPNSPDGFEAFLDRLDAPVEAVFECGLNWGYLHDLLESLPCVSKVVLANAQQTRIIADAQIKTDKIDARKLAWLLRADLIPAIHIPDRATRARREVIRQRMFLVRSRTRLRNRVHRILERQPRLQLPQVSDLFGRKGIAAMKKADLPAPDDRLLRQDLGLLASLETLIKENEEAMKRAGQADASMKIVTSIPGIGLTIGSILCAEIDGIDRFVTPKRLVAYAGLAPSTYSSGGKTRQGRMLIGCNKWLKWAFIEAAWVAVGCSSYFGGLYRSHRARGKKANTAITIVARRMCRIVWQLLNEKREYEKKRNVPSGRPHHGLTKAA